VIRRVKRFVEKPDLATAKRYVKSENFSGMPACSSGAPRFPDGSGAECAGAGEVHPRIPKKSEAAYIADKFPTLGPKTSLDFAIMEKARAVETVLSSLIGMTSACGPRCPSTSRLTHPATPREARSWRRER